MLNIRCETLTAGNNSPLLCLDYHETKFISSTEKNLLRCREEGVNY